MGSEQGEDKLWAVGSGQWAVGCGWLRGRVAACVCVVVCALRGFAIEQKGRALDGV